MSAVPDVHTSGGLRMRVVTSVLMLPLMLGAIYLGSPVFDLLIVAVAAVLIWEWQGLLSPIPSLMHAVAIVGTAVAVSVSLFDWRYAFLGLGAIAAGLGLSALKTEHRADFFLLCLGPIYVGIPCVAVLELRNDFGFGVTTWVFAMIWATDIGAYAFGRVIGGPKLAPRISPKKTWAGLLGGMICAAGVGFIGAELPVFSGINALSPIDLALLGAMMAVIAQVGDLFESAIKRRAGVKDSSHLIPGHGGVLDRVDGVLTVAPVAFLIFIVLRNIGAMV
ncbi:MAG: phosphatidate cytidylyltransferase [Rhodospirillaceae bacterium]|nr:phosphatidate cytidylyltransferase [Rhodospirillaceae bacterium]